MKALAILSREGCIPTPQQEDSIVPTEAKGMG
jgi:hypothetical protein